MEFIPFYEYFPEIAERETRFLLVRDHDQLPAGDYGIMESYCSDPNCDCRRVFLNILNAEQGFQFLACIGYGWEKSSYYAKWFGHDDPEWIEEMKGPSLNMASSQSHLAPIFLKVVKEVLKDKNYVERLKDHYQLFKAKLKEEKPLNFQRQSNKVGRNEPCPCGSGKKFKKCCALEGLTTMEAIMWNQKTKDQVFQFKIVLKDTDPPVWRRIQVPASYSFWDLHVAIQDAMGWTDSHLHEFNIKKQRIGIPSDEEPFFSALPKTQAGWEKNIADYFSPQNKKADYLYDFGDSWEHTVTLEKTLPKDSTKTYPLCLDGKRACPPEDCGGTYGYLSLCRGEHWMQEEGMEADFDPELFDVLQVDFEDPKDRLENVLL